MISKELLSEVLDDEIVYYNIHLYGVNEIDICVGIESGEPVIYTENIYELAHKCKEWAEKNGYWIDSNLGFVSIGCRGTRPYVKCFNGYDLKLNEAELIFKACEWILKDQQ